MTGGHVVLVGLMGTGKSTVGRKVARALGRDFVDADSEFEVRQGRSIRDFFDQFGEEEFRMIESQVLSDLLSTERPLVVATGGGVVLSEANRNLLRSAGHVVWLRASVETLVKRLSTTRGLAKRPLLDGDVEDRLRTMERDRADLYQSVADATIDVDSRTADAVCELVVASHGGVA